MTRQCKPLADHEQRSCGKRTTTPCNWISELHGVFVQTADLTNADLKQKPVQFGVLSSRHGCSNPVTF